MINSEYIIFSLLIIFLLKIHHINEYFSNIKDDSKKIHWKSFGTDISSDFLKEKKSEFRVISTPNISIEKFNITNNIKTNDSKYRKIKHRS